MVIEVKIPIEADSDNSYSCYHLEVSQNNDISMVTLKMTNPDREIVVNKEDLKKALEIL